MTNNKEHENLEFDALAETISDIVYKIDEKGRFTYLNSNVRHLGYTADELIGKHFSELIVPTEVENISRKFVLSKLHDKATGGEEAPRLFDERRSADRKTSGLEARIAVKGKKKLTARRNRRNRQKTHHCRNKQLRNISKQPRSHIQCIHRNHRCYKRYHPV